MYYIYETSHAELYKVMILSLKVCNKKCYAYFESLKYITDYNEISHKNKNVKLETIGKSKVVSKCNWQPILII